jgi:putative hydrolase of HD superfamily
MKNIVDFLFEAGFLKKLKRTGFAYLGSGEESVADHTCRTLFVAYVLGQMNGDVDMGRLMKMCLFHDLPEARMGDLNYVNKKYLESGENKILREIADRLPFGEEVASLVLEFNQRETPEARIANDADQLDLLLHVKEEMDKGNLRAAPWLEFTFQRLETEPAKQLARIALETDSTDWWLSEEKDAKKI